MRAKFIYEKFIEDSDPITDMNIGMMRQIKEWLESKGYEYEDKDNALIKCAKHGKTEFVRYLLDAGADVHADNDEALRWASENGHVEVVKLLLNAGADVHANDDYALRYASYYGRTEVVKILLDAGADVHAYNDAALRWASYYGRTEVVKLLLDAGADVHADNDDALRWASNHGHIEVVKLLKDHIAKEKKLKKRIKESLNERFTYDENSDPIADMGIGLDKISVDLKAILIFYITEKTRSESRKWLSPIQIEEFLKNQHKKSFYFGKGGIKVLINIAYFVEKNNNVAYCGFEDIIQNKKFYIKYLGKYYKIK